MSAVKEAKCKVSKLHKAYQASENPAVSSHHMVTSTVASFDENETAQMPQIVEMLNSSHSMEGFKRKLREHIVPKVLDAHQGFSRILITPHKLISAVVSCYEWYTFVTALYCTHKAS